MADKPWKNFERSVGVTFGVKRRLMKGTKEMADLGTDDNFPLILDCKLRKRWELHRWLQELRVYALEEGKGREAVLVVRKPPYLKRYALVSFHWLWDQMKAANVVDMFTILHKDRSMKWSIIDWFKEAEKKAEDENKIAMLTVDGKYMVQYAVVSPNVLSSVLRSAGVLPPQLKEDGE